MKLPGDIDGLRAAVDDIDDQLIALLNRRARLAMEIGRLKTAAQHESNELRVASRERAILERLERRSRGPLANASIKLIFDEIFKACLNIQK
ncbi:MAG: chorismate mutase [Holophagales bacterium]|nr:chorismate mutase [Holophagales bacterium]